MNNRFWGDLLDWFVFFPPGSSYIFPNSWGRPEAIETQSYDYPDNIWDSNHQQDYLKGFLSLAHYYS